nr:FAD-dependent oxidoreductase [Dactylosporangium thailandense]
MPSTLDVLVVGAGPAGLTLALDLRRRGVACRVISAAPGGFEGPLTIPVAMYRRRRPAPDVPHPDTLLVPQYRTDAALRGRLGELGGRVEFATTVETVLDGPEHVTATVRGPAGAEAIPARYVVGADGGASTVRHLAGIAFEGRTDESDRMIVADVTVRGPSRDRWHIWPRRHGRFVALCPLPGGRFQLMYRLRRAEEADTSPGALAAALAALPGRAKPVLREVHWASVWRPNIRIAARYRLGWLLLTGDAGHVHPPTGAQGMNTGIQDAYNLGWKLAQVLAGAPDGLLDTYEAERRPVAAHVLGLAGALYTSLDGKPRKAIRRGDEERQLRLSYAGGPLAPAGPASGVRPGDRAPDAVYQDEDGRHRRLHDAFRGPHFTLLAVGADAIAGLPGGVWPAHGAALRTVSIPRPPARLRRTYGIRGPAQILVRPDGYVASVAHGAWRDALAESAARMAPPRP